jgi:LiaI-LiaF-like transmembrane region
MYRTGRIFWPLVLIAVGVLFLVDQLSNGAFDAGAFIGRWWPLLIVGIGLAILLDAAWMGRSAPDVPVAIDLAGSAAGDVRIDFGAGRLEVGAAAPGRLVDGVLGGGGRVESDGPGRVRLRSDTAAWWAGHWPGAGGFRWRVGIAADVPIALRVDTGASDNFLDLSQLRIVNLEIHAGASETRIVLPQSAGNTTVRVEAGVAAVRLRVPPGVAARIAGTMAMGSATVDERRFPRTGPGWISAGWASAPNRVDIAYQGGMGGLFVE